MFFIYIHTAYFYFFFKYFDYFHFTLLYYKGNAVTYVECWTVVDHHRK